MRFQQLIFRSMLIGLLILSCSSCGVISKSRFGNGLKLNFELFSKTKIDSSYLRKRVQHKKVSSDQISSIPINKEVLLIDSWKKVKSSIIFKESNDTIFDLLERKSNQRKLKRLKYFDSKNEKVLSDTTKPVSGRKDVPYVKNAKLSGWLFYGGIFLSILCAIIAPYIFIIGFGIPLGIILSTIGFTIADKSYWNLKIYKSQGKSLKGAKLLKSIKIVYSTIIVISIIIMILAFVWLYYELFVW